MTKMAAKMTVAIIFFNEFFGVYLDILIKFIPKNTKNIIRIRLEPLKLKFWKLLTFSTFWHFQIENVKIYDIDLFFDISIIFLKSKLPDLSLAFLPDRELGSNLKMSNPKMRGFRRNALSKIVTLKNENELRLGIAIL